MSKDEPDVRDLLRTVQEKIDSGEFSLQELDMLKEDLNNFIAHERGLDPEAVKCLFAGWWLRTSLRNNGVNPDQMNG